MSDKDGVTVAFKQPSLQEQVEGGTGKGEIPPVKQELRPDAIMENIEEKTGHVKKEVIPVKTWNVDWDILLLRGIKSFINLFKKEN